MSAIKGGAVLVVGDLHLSDKFVGGHQDYRATCRFVMSRIQTMLSDLKEKHGSVSLFLLGDLFGVSEKRFTSRTFFLEVAEWFTALNELTNSHTYSVRGNHDIAHNDLSDFEVFSSLGLFKVPDYVDYHAADDDGIRFHFVHYGHENDDLTYSKSLINIGLAHNDFGLPGHPEIEWFPNEDAILLERQKNLQDLTMLLVGHIHKPTPHAYVTMPNGNELQMIYPGNPTRVSEPRVDDVFAVSFAPSEDGYISFGAEYFNLPPVEEEFREDYLNPPESETKALSEETIETLKTIVGRLNGKSLFDGDLISQINNRMDVPESVKSLAIKYLEAEL